MTTQIIPALSQRAAALIKANQSRTARAALKRHWKHVGNQAAREAFINIIGAPAQELATMRTADLLAAIPGVGPKRIRTALITTRISDATTIGDLTPRQRHAIAEWVTYIDPTECPICGGTKSHESAQCNACRLQQRRGER